MGVIEKYDKDQLEQILLGLKNKIDISMYESTDFMALQMSWIRKGLEKGYDVSVYANPSFDWFQMEEIYLGMESGINVYKYASVNVPYERMREIRKGLEAGVDLAPFIKYNASQLRELRLALEDKTNIVKYLVEGYDAEQLQEIRIALKNKINIDPYLSKEYRGVALREIRIGLEKKLNVEAYAMIYYSWQQMREIREGLEERLDISLYSNELYNASQMHEIRLGLEMGLDVSEYRSLMYTANDMRKKRLKLVEEFAGGTNIAMVRGKDGYHEYLFDKTLTGGMAYTEQGSVDMDRSFMYATCKAGDVLAIYHPAEAGTNGISEDGKIIKAVKGKEMNILKGRGIYYNDAEKKYIASVDGWICLDEKKSTLDISEITVIKQIVDEGQRVLISGNALVEGNVKAGAILEADGDLIINGHVEEATIKCTGNIVIRGGVSGGGKTTITTKESLCSAYIENSTVTAKKDVAADYVLSSKISADGEVKILGKRGSIISSLVEAKKGITCKQAGNEAGATAVLTIIYPESKGNIQELDKKKTILKELEILNQAYENYKEKYSPEERNINPNFIKIEKAIYTKNNELAQIEKEIEIINKENQCIGTARIIVTDNTYSGVEFNFGQVCSKSNRETGRIVAESSRGRVLFTRENK